MSHALTQDKIKRAVCMYFDNNGWIVTTDDKTKVMTATMYGGCCNFCGPVHVDISELAQRIHENE